MSFVKGETLNVKCSSWEVWPLAYRLWPGRDTVIFVIRFTFHVSPFTSHA